MRYLNIDFEEFLSVIRTNTRYYLDDLILDRRIVKAAALIDDPSKKHLLYMSRRCGTHCFFEKDVFLRNSAQHNTWLYYEDQADGILAYAIYIRGLSGEKIMVDVTELDYMQHARSVREKSVKADFMRLVYKDETITISASNRINTISPESGMLLDYELIPNDKDELDTLLDSEYKKHEEAEIGNIKDLICSRENM